ncbi:MAG: S-methyl-5-thioribose-1-phosphate isomerase [Candelina mexicana]|nr:MAG: S-methyl-5-thioribose-1-phosphate isomerase [Candelina mexicana]
MVLEAIKYTRGTLETLDQRQLPHETYYDDIEDTRDARHAIKDMRVRGAPAIAIVAALSLAVELTSLHEKRKLPAGAEDVKQLVEEKLDYLVKSRPTAVNLMDAAHKLKKVSEDAAGNAEATGESVQMAYVEASERMLVDDVQDNEAIGEHGAAWIIKNTEGYGPEGKVSVLTHCNTGSLATAGYGTALGIVRALHASSHLHIAYYTETRPYNQGSRLTAYELKHEKIPSCLITDSMAAALLNTKRRSMNIVAIIVGADRVAANGDTANKVGTYSLAILARHHGVKFLVAAPRTTIDLSTKSGKDIIIEERPKREVTTVTGPRDVGGFADQDHIETVSIAPHGIQVWNPAFDVTPATLIDAVVTEKGVVEKGPKGTFSFDGLFEGPISNGSADDGQEVEMAMVGDGLTSLSHNTTDHHDHEHKRKREDE